MKNDLGIIWRGRSSDELGVVITRLPPPQTAQQRAEQIVIPGRSGVLHLPDGGYEEYPMIVEGYLPYDQDGDPVAPLHVIREWLTGKGNLQLSDTPGWVHRARISDPVLFPPWVVGFADRTFAASFWSEPFLYEAVPTVYKLTTARTLYNPGTMFAEPQIRIEGGGTIVLTIGTQVLTISGVDGYIDIDCEAQLARKGAILQNHKLTGDYPTLSVGPNPVSWVGSATKVIITPNWRLK